jgi:predicted acyl esterase
VDSVKTVVQDGMRISFDVPIEMDDGLVLYADVFAPEAEGRFPVLMTMGPYAKGLAFQEGWKFNWDKLVKDWPEVAEGTSNKYANWETVDPEKWVPDGYVCVRVDSRGAGRSPGVLDPWSPRETQDFYECIEWAGTQPWSNGKVGLSGISYYAMNQWQVAALQPPHLTAMLVQEGAADFYREFTRHGGILSRFLSGWFQGLIKQVQHGLGENGTVSRVTGELIAGPDTLSAEELEKNRVDPYETAVEHPLLDSFFADRTANLSKVVTPFLSCGNWGGQGLHPRGNIEGYLGAASPQKWLEMHGDTHSSGFYTDYGVAMQRRFFGHFLKGEDTGWDKQPPVALRVRHPGEVFVDRGEQQWPLARTRWTKFYLNSGDRSLGGEFTPGEAVGYETTGDGIVFRSAPLSEATEITGPVAAKVFLSSDTEDADVFACLQVFDPDGDEITFQGSNDPRTPIGLGWLRASHRKLDPARTLPYRPFHTHDEAQPLTPGEPVELDIEIWPTCLVIPAGCRIALMLRGRDYDNGAELVPGARYPLRGIGPFRHDDERDRPPAVFGGTNTLHFAAGQESYLLLPVIPA